MSETSEIIIPDKTFFKIGEVAKLLNLEPYVLRYWESEFDLLDPDKTDSGQRVYQKKDIELICQIRRLLYDDMFTIAGARRQLELELAGPPSVDAHDAPSAPAQAAGAQIGLWEQRLVEQNQQLEQLQAQLARAQNQQVETGPLQHELDQTRQTLEKTRRELAQAHEELAVLEDVRAQLAQAQQTIQSLQSLQARPTSNTTSNAIATLDPAILQSLRHQVEQLASLGRAAN